MFGAEHDLRNDRDEQDRQDILVFENLQRDIGALDRFEAVHDECEEDEADRQDPSQSRGSQPHQIVAIDQKIGDEEHEEADEQSCPDVYSAEGHALGHGAERAAEGELDEDHQTHRSNREDMHHLPCEMEGEDGSEPCAAGDGGEEDDMQDREEDAEIAGGGHPELDITHTFERALYLRHAGDETDWEKDRHVGGGHGDEIADADEGCGSAEELLVGEAELHPEEQREIDRHACESGVKEHQQVFQHECRGAADGFERAEIDASGELDTEDLEDIDPWADASWHPVMEHGHGERHGYLGI